MTTRIEWHPGDALRVARSRSGYTQANFALAMRERLGPAGKKWRAADVSETEQRRYDPTFTEIRAMSEITGYPMRWFYEGPGASLDIPGHFNSDFADAAQLRLKFPRHETGLTRTTFSSAGEELLEDEALDEAVASRKAQAASPEGVRDAA